MLRMFGWIVGVLLCGVGAAAAQERVIYKCPGNLYTDNISAKEATERSCKAIEGGGITVIQGAAPPRRAALSGEGGAPRTSEARVDPADQKARDADKRRILESELRREQDRLAALRLDYNAGEPERRGDERNFQKYQDRVAAMKADIERTESDIASLKRELAKLPSN